MTYVVELEGAMHPAEVVGGKAASLDRLVAAGFPVPRSAAVTADAYRLFLEENSLTEALTALVSAERASLESPHASDEPFELEVERLFTTSPMPDVVAEELLAVAHELGGDGPFAVRSSATAEDTDDASFAGQYSSEIGVSAAELLTAVKRVWSSLWSPAVVAYRGHGEVDETGLAMAVIVMPVVQAELAGVVFTVDPGGLSDHVRIELVEGLAEGLVGGSETPDALVVPRVQPRHLPEELEAVLDPLVDLALEVEATAGRPQDIEWVFADDLLQLVQARAITTTSAAPDDDDGFDTPALPGTTYTSAGIAEMLPGVLPPLQWTLAGPILEAGFRELLDELGVLPEDLTGDHGVVGRFRGRAAVNLDLLRETAARVPGGSAQEMERQYFGRVVSGEDSSPHAGRAGSPSGLGKVASLAAVRRALRLRRAAIAEATLLVEAAELVLGAHVRIADLDDAQLSLYLTRLEDLGQRLGSTQVRVAASAAAAYRGLEVFLARYRPDRASELAQDLTAGAVRSPASTGAGEGARASTSVFGGPTWDESPGGTEVPADDGGQAAAEGPGRPADPGRTSQRSSDPAEVLAALEAELTRNWRWQALRFATLQFVDLRKRLLRRLVADAAGSLSAREETKAALLALGGEVRRTCLEAARRLVGRGELPSVDDVDLLGRDELDPGAALPDRAELGRRRAALDAAEDAGPLPQRFQGRPGPVHLADEGSGTIEGWGASAGRHTGRVRIVSNPRTAEVEPGDVLVAHATDPSWTPLMLRAGAIVVEEGGPLSHAAIIARELGVPAVLNAPGALARLKDVEVVTVDGRAGTVEVVDAHETADEGDAVGATT